MKWQIIILLVLVMFSVGCSSVVPPPSVESYNPNIANPLFSNYINNNNCIQYTGNYTSLSCNATAFDSMPAALTWNSTTDLWTVNCCEFNPNICHVEISGNGSGLCKNTTQAIVYQTLVDGSTIRARCCNNYGSNCYIDNTVNPSNASSTCNRFYTQFPISINVTNGTWTAMCCEGGSLL